MNAGTPLQSQESAATSATLLLIPGMLNDTSIWDGVIAGIHEQLGNTVQVLVADVVTQDSIKEMALDAWKQLAQVSPETPCYVAGFSMGGYVAMEMLSHPERPIREAWLISTSARPESPDSAPMREKAIDSYEKDFEKSIQSTARWCTFEKQPEALEPIIAAMRTLGPEVAIRQTRAIMRRSDPREMLRALSLPVHVLCGAEDRITPADMSRELAAMVPGAQLQLAEKAGHMLPFEQPAFIAQSLCSRLAT